MAIGEKYIVKTYSMLFEGLSSISKMEHQWYLRSIVVALIFHQAFMERRDR